MTITLANPVAIPATLGGTATTDYDTFSLDEFVTFNAKSNQIDARGHLSASGNSAAPSLFCTITINATTGLIVFEIPQLDRKIVSTLSQGQKTAAAGRITTAQSNLEADLLAIGVIISA